MTPTKPTRNDGVSDADPDAEVQDNESEEEGELASKKKRPLRHVLKYVVVKRWVTGKRSEKDEDRLQHELEDSRRQLIDLSGQRKVFGHKSLPTDKGFWKLERLHTDKRGITYDVYCCPMCCMCKCDIDLRVVTGPNF